MSKLKKRLIIAAACLTGVLIIMIGSMEYTSRSEFCSTCHYMDTFYAAWQRSSHRNVDCIVCHYPPGIKNKFKGKITGLEQVFMYLTQSYRRSRPWAEIPDASCLRSGCHETRLIEGKAPFKEGIVFDHTPHLTQLRDGKKLRCTSCHSQIVQGEHITVTETTCFLCHFKGRESEATSNCTTCHQPPVNKPGIEVSYDHTIIIQRKIACQKCHGEMVVGDGAVPIENCENCHFQKDYLAQYSDTTQIHNIHITQHKVECQRCHLQIQHKSISRTPQIKPDCNSCHPDFHQAQLDMFLGQGGQGVQSYPSPMYEGGLNCQACHIFHQNAQGFQPAGETYTASRNSCEPCHGAGYGKLVGQWRQETEKRLSTMAGLIDRVESALSRVDTTSESGMAVAQDLRNARYNYHLVEYGKSVHNITYADRLLKASYSYLGQAVKASGVRYTLPAYPWSGELVLPECASCHAGIEKVKVPVYGVEFDHGRHLMSGQIESCRTCHSNMRRHGEMMKTQDECLSCHHDEKNTAGENCAPCHDTQRSMYQGTAFKGADPDFMSAAEVPCSGCHVSPDSAAVVRPTGATCAGCHDDSYKETLAQWQKNTQEEIDQIDALLAKLDKTTLSPDKAARVREARQTVEVFKKDGSRGVHNSQLADARLSDAIQKLKGLLPSS